MTYRERKGVYAAIFHGIEGQSGGIGAVTDALQAATPQHGSPHRPVRCFSRSAPGVVLRCRAVRRHPPYPLKNDDLAFEEVDLIDECVAIFWKKALHPSASFSLVVRS
jgi:hypothetical protein